MNLNEQVELLMQGTEYGDENLRQTMENELRQRLIEADKDGRPLRIYCGYDPRTADQARLRRSSNSKERQ